MVAFTPSRHPGGCCKLLHGYCYVLQASAIGLRARCSDKFAWPARKLWSPCHDSTASKVGHSCPLCRSSILCL